MLRIARNAIIWNKKIFSIQITLVDLASQQTVGNHDPNCVESMGKTPTMSPKWSRRALRPPTGLVRLSTTAKMTAGKFRGQFYHNA